MIYYHSISCHTEQEIVEAFVQWQLEMWGYTCEAVAVSHNISDDYVIDILIDLGKDARASYDERIRLQSRLRQALRKAYGKPYRVWVLNYSPFILLGQGPPLSRADIEDIIGATEPE